MMANEWGVFTHYMKNNKHHTSQGVASAIGFGHNTFTSLFNISTKWRLIYHRGNSAVLFPLQLKLCIVIKGILWKIF